jgi:plastocyanin
MLDQLWNGILEFLAQFVIPDWGGLIALLPVGIVALVAVGLIWTFRRLLSAPRTRRGAGRQPPRTPPGIHMPGPSFSPILAAIGVFLLFVGLVFGGAFLAVGGIALVLTLLYWLAEALRVYDHDVEPTRSVVASRDAAEPPPGIHMPGPSFRPLLGALGTALLLLGLVFGGWLLAVGLLALIIALIGWLADARHEYVKTVDADRTGHLESMPPPPTPSRLFATLAVLVVVAAVLQSGALTGGAANGGSAGPSAKPGGSAAPPPSAGASAPAASSPAGSPPAGAPADVTIEAKGVAFTQGSWTAPADKPFTIAFDNEDPGTPHNVALKDSGGTEVWKGDIFNGPETRVYQVPALPAGSYTFVCSVHPNMSGTATLQ